MVIEIVIQGNGHLLCSQLGGLRSYHDACTKHMPNAEGKSELRSKPCLNKRPFFSEN